MRIVERPDTFDRVDRIKREVTGQPIEAGDDELYILGGPMVVDARGYRSAVTWTVPAGFVTDGASIPWAAREVTGWGKFVPPQRWAAILHDWLYHSPREERFVVDHVFRMLLRAEGAGRVKAWVMWAAVRVGGWKAWGEDQREAPMIYSGKPF